MNHTLLYILALFFGFILGTSESETFTPNIIGLTIAIASGIKLKRIEDASKE